MSKIKDITFETELVISKVADAEGSKNIILVVDNYGYICGVFATEALAQAAIPNIRSNVLRGHLLGGYKQPKKYVHNSHRRM